MYTGTLTRVRGFHTSEFDTVLGALSTLTWRSERAEWVCPCVCVVRGRRPFSIRLVLSTEIVPREIKFSAVKVPPQPPLALLLTTTNVSATCPQRPFRAGTTFRWGDQRRRRAWLCPPLFPSALTSAATFATVPLHIPPTPPRLPPLHNVPSTNGIQIGQHKTKASDPSTCLCCRPPSPCLRTHQHDVSNSSPSHSPLSFKRPTAPLRGCGKHVSLSCHMMGNLYTSFVYSFIRSHLSCFGRCLCLSDMHSCAPSDPQQVGWTRPPRLANKLERKAERGCVLHQEGQR
jgi:hypothetical protein